jgi:hypothetical protein
MARLVFDQQQDGPAQAGDRLHFLDLELTRMAVSAGQIQGFQVAQ